MALVLHIGECAVYPSRGLVEVTSIEPREIAGQRQDFYVLKVLTGDAPLMVPTAGAERVGLRAVASRADSEEVFDVLRSDEVAVAPGPWNRRFREYTELVNSGCLTQVAQVFRDLLRMQPGRELSFGERRLLEQSKQLLVSELALARECTPEVVEADMEGAVTG